MNVRRVAVFLGLLVGLVGTTVRADDSVSLGFNLAKGDKLIYRAKTEMKQTQKIMDMTLENELNSEAFSSFTVDDIDDKGNFKLTVKGERMKVKASFGPLGDYVFDSQSSERDRSSMIGAAVTPLFERLSTATYHAAISPSGEIVEVKGYADLIRDLLADNPLAAQFAGGGTDEAAKQSLQEQFPKFAKAQVKVGETWEVPSDLTLPGIGKIRGKAVYRYVGPDTVNGRKTAKIEVGGEMAMDLDIDQGGAKVTGTLASTGSSGVIHFDIEKGRVLSSEGTVTLGGDLSVAAGGMNIPIRNDQRITQKSELLDKLPE